MAEYATKGQGTAGVTLGTIGTVLGGLATLGGVNGGGLLGGILGNNTGASMGISSALAEKDAKIAELTAQKYSDTQDAILYKATVDENKSLRNDLFAYITPLVQESASNRERVAVLEATMTKNQEINSLKEQLVRKDLDNLATVVSNQGNLLSQITSTVVPKSAICPEVMSRYNSWTAPTTTATGS